MTETSTKYPLNFSVDYPEKLNRLTTLFRLPMVLPIFIVLALLAGSSGSQGSGTGGDWGWQYGGAAAITFAPLVLMLLFRKKYPRWWFDWNIALTKFCLRFTAYLSLLRDEYPSTDEEQAVHLEIDYPDASKDLKRGMPLVKWFLAIPHYIILSFLWFFAIVCVVIAWFAILLTGRYPRGLFDFVVGVYRWSLRVDVYALLLTTDRYPPFSLND
ncbi:DUF4389 domain-containing protein [Chloroflexota bacterium]